MGLGRREGEEPPGSVRCGLVGTNRQQVGQGGWGPGAGGILVKREDK